MKRTRTISVQIVGTSAGKMPPAAQNVNANGAKGRNRSITMCENLKPIPNESAIVYKIVAKKLKGRCYYSIAMGFKYPKLAGKIPKVRIQHCLGFFISTILVKKLRAYRHQMVGRTAGFVDRKAANQYAAKIRGFGYKLNIHETIVVKAKLTDGLMSGTYSGDCVIAGKYIEWLE